MSPLPPVVRPPSSSASGADPACRVNHVVPTSAIFAAALERLNRTSTIDLFQQLTQEIDAHCRTLGGAVVGAGMGAGAGRPAEGAARAELVALLTLLRETTEQHRSEIVLIQKQLSDLQALSARSQGEFDAQMSALFNRHIEQSLTPALTAASTRIEQNVATVFDRDLKQIETRLAKEVATRERPARRGWLLTMLLVLLIGGLCVLIGLLLGRRSFSQPCPAVSCCAGGGDGRSGIGPATSAVGAVGATGAIVAPMGALNPGTGATRESEISGISGNSGSSGMRGAAVPSGGSAAPGAMEAELERFLKLPGTKGPRAFVMDRLQFSSGSHEVNEAGKDQVRALAQILNSYPKAQIEIRGHSDGAEGEVYSGSDQHPGMSLSLIRADCILKRLTFQRVPSARMRITGMGAQRPVADGGSEEGRRRNRRVEIVVTTP